MMPQQGGMVSADMALAAFPGTHQKDCHALNNLPDIKVHELCYQGYYVNNVMSMTHSILASYGNKIDVK